MRPIAILIGFLLVCYFTCLTSVVYGQSADGIPSVREYIEALYVRDDPIAVRAICDSWITNGTATKNAGLTAQGIARQAYANALFAAVPFEERKADFDKALAMVPLGSNVWRANVLIAAGSHNGSYGNDISGGLKLVEEGILIARQLEDDALMAEGYTGASQSLALLGQNSRGMDFSLRALRYAEAAKDDILIGSAVQMVHSLAVFSDCLREAQPLIRLHADKLPETEYQMFLANYGTEEEQLQLLSVTLDALQDESAEQKVRALSGLTSAVILQKLGRAEEALKPLRLARDILEGADSATEAELAEIEFQLLLKLGRTKQALGVGTDALLRLRKTRFSKHARAVARELSEVYLELGRAEEAGQMLEQADVLRDDLLSSFFQQSSYSAKQAFDFDFQARAQTRRIREQEQVNLQAVEELNRTRTIAFTIPLFGLIFWSMLRLRGSKKQRKQLAEQVQLKTQSLTDATAEAQRLRERAEAANRALLDSEVKYRQLVEDAADVTWLGDLSGNLIYLSPQFESVFGFDPNNWLGKPSSDLVHPEDREVFGIELAELLNAPAKPVTVEFRHLCKNGLYIWVMAKATAILDGEGKVIRHQGILRDNSERKIAELQMQEANIELARATKMKDEFLANMSHELRTPLNAILGMNQGLQRGIFGPVTEKQQDSYEVIQASGDHLLELINEVLDLAKIESGSMELELTSIQVSKLCESSLQLVTQQADEKNIELNLNVPFGLPEFAGDEKRLRQVLVNLLSNAVKFTPSNGTVSVEVQNDRQASSDEEVLRISVSDTGIGIAPDDLDKLFEPFVQVDSSLGRKFSGTGLGLSLVKRFISLHSGSVAVTSEIGVGSCFTVEVPYKSVTSRSCGERDSIEGSELDVAGGRSRLSKPATILLAEDNTNVASATKMYLEFAEMKVFHVLDGEMAIDLAESKRPDLILMDIQMPGLDGFAAIERIRSIPELKTTPIIALTGLAMPSDEIRCIQAGATDYLSKPYSMASLVKTIRSHLEN